MRQQTMHVQLQLLCVSGHVHQQLSCPLHIPLSLQLLQLVMTIYLPAQPNPNPSEAPRPEQGQFLQTLTTEPDMKQVQ